jgi:hypothetical protein
MCTTRCVFCREGWSFEVDSLADDDESFLTNVTYLLGDRWSSHGWMLQVELHCAAGFEELDQALRAGMGKDLTPEQVRRRVCRSFHSLAH